MGYDRTTQEGFKLLRATVRVRNRSYNWNERGWFSANRRITHHNGQSHAANRRYWQERVDNGRLQRHDGSGRPRATADREVRVIIRPAVTAPDSSQSGIRYAIRIRVSIMALHRRLIEQNLRS
ncbi:HTH_Tnp_Tc3_2 domain-containing protein [Trichonephila clavipes]|nr:HTH_Tnp_Tc3_2 domain-containing protein [Trichonephila clavipes]